jgi:ribosome recycling factor
MSSYQYLVPEPILDHFIHALSGLRTGRINSSILDTIKVEFYGSKMSIKELATITLPEPMQIWITPFDKGANKAIYEAILNSNLGVSPVDDGAGIRLNFPPLTEENRKSLVKVITALMEDARVAVRNHRQDLIKKFKAQKENKEITEDDIKNIEEKIQKEVDQINAKIKEIAAHKEAEIMKF